MDTWVWIVIAIVVIAVVVVLAVMLGRRRNESRLNQRLEKAEELRTRGQEEDLHAKDQAAEAARQQADAQRARMEAERLEREAQERAAEADRARQAAPSHTFRMPPGSILGTTTRAPARPTTRSVAPRAGRGMALPGSVTIPASAAETGWRASPCAAAGAGGDRLLHDCNGTRPRGGYWWVWSTSAEPSRSS